MRGVAGRRGGGHPRGVGRLIGRGRRVDFRRRRWVISGVDGGAMSGCPGGVRFRAARVGRAISGEGGAVGSEVSGWSGRPGSISGGASGRGEGSAASSGSGRLGTSDWARANGIIAVGPAGGGTSEGAWRGARYQAYSRSPNTTLTAPPFGMLSNCAAFPPRTPTSSKPDEPASTTGSPASTSAYVRWTPARIVEPT